MNSVNGSGSPGVDAPDEPLTALHPTPTRQEHRPMGTLSPVSPPSVSGTRREIEVRHHERQLCSTELLILAGRAADQDVAGVLIEAAVAISRRKVA